MGKCSALTTVKLTDFRKLPHNVRNFIAEQGAAILATNSKISHLDLESFSWRSDKGEGTVVLSALANSNSLPTLTHLKVSTNESWFSKGKETNVDLLCDAIRAMTSLEYLDLGCNIFSTEGSDKVFNAIKANRELNPNLVDIDLFEAGGSGNFYFSSSSRECIEAMIAQGLTIAVT